MGLWFFPVVFTMGVGALRDGVSRTAFKLGFLLVCLGGSLGMLLPLRGLADPIVNWGHPITLSKTVNHAARSQYAGAGGSESRTSIAKRLSHYFSEAKTQWPLLGWVSAACGVAAGIWWLRNWWVVTFFWFLLTTGGLMALVSMPSTEIAGTAIAVLYVASYGVAAIWIGWGFMGTASWFGGWAAAVLALSVTGWTFASNRSRGDLSMDHSVYAYATGVIQSVGPEEVVVSEGDSTDFGLLYLYAVGETPRDILIGSRAGNVLQPVYGLDFGSLDPTQQRVRRTMVDRELAREHRLNLIHYDRFGDESQLRLGGFDVEPRGLVFRTGGESSDGVSMWKRLQVKSRAPGLTDEFWAKDLAGRVALMKRLFRESRPSDRASFNEWRVKAADLQKRRKDLPEWYVEMGRHGIEGGEIQEALAVLREGGERHPGSPLLLKAIGNAEYLCGNNRQAMEWWGRALRLQPGDSDLQRNMETLERRIRRGELAW